MAIWNRWWTARLECFFAEQTPKSLVETLQRFEKMKLNSEEIKKHAAKFGPEEFRRQIKAVIDGAVK